VRVLALAHMAGFDGNLARHDSKYVYWVPRPTQVDPGIRLAIGVPNHLPIQATRGRYPDRPSFRAAGTIADGRRQAARNVRRRVRRLFVQSLGGALVQAFN